MVYRILVQKKPMFEVEADNLKQEIAQNLSISLERLAVINCYDVEGVAAKHLESIGRQILSQPNVDFLHANTDFLADYDFWFRYGYHIGQYDQRADSAMQCIAMVYAQSAIVRSSQIIAIKGNLTDKQKNQIKNYIINPVDSTEMAIWIPETLATDSRPEELVRAYDGFNHYNSRQQQEFIRQHQLAMSQQDLELIRQYFSSEDREPTETEIKVLDTYWSDHCRHTTFLTTLQDIQIESGRYLGRLEEAYQMYLADRQRLKTEKPITLMDIATLSLKKERQQGKLEQVDLSDEINACSIKVGVACQGKVEDCFLMFKNETHNHPTEIEPFGGAATCLGGAIRDPLSGRAYVYQSMRITGAADPNQPFDQTIQGKLPQYQITRKATQGFSSYGNQIGIATGYVREYYHSGFLAKRLEMGAVVGAVKQSHVKRETPQPGDVVLLVGGKTGQDGCGGATGSSLSLEQTSVITCSAQVQKGNPVEERKLQRLFQNQQAAVLIKRCNDFGAGGVAVAIGEIAESIDIDLSQVPTKYDGINATQLAISESQERMAVVVAANQAEQFIALAAAENLTATPVATVTDNRRLKMAYGRQTVVDLSRDFLDTNGANRSQTVIVKQPTGECYFERSVQDQALSEYVQALLADLNVASQQGLVEYFDASIGSKTVLNPFGGRYAKTPIEAMVSKIPIDEISETETVSIISHGYNPFLSDWSCFHGGVYAVVEAISRIIAVGGDYRGVVFSFQEYYPALEQDPLKWGKPFSALLGAYLTLDAFDTAAIGGKDSMSGSFEQLDVPPTFIAVGVTTEEVEHIITPELKEPGSQLLYYDYPRTEDYLPDFCGLKRMYDEIIDYIRQGKIKSAYTIGHGGAIESILKMSFGNKIGVEIECLAADLIRPNLGGFICEFKGRYASNQARVIGTTKEQSDIIINQHHFKMADLIRQWEAPLAKIYPISKPQSTDWQPIDSDIEWAPLPVSRTKARAVRKSKPKVVIPVFPGTNCEHDTGRAFDRAGAKVEYVMIRNRHLEDIEDSLRQLEQALRNCQILAFPGGFSGGDEPDGSGKFIASFCRNPRIQNAITDLLNKDSLILGICNGFQVLINLGLLPFEKTRIDADSPILTHNSIGRHIARYTDIKVCHNHSPWLAYTEPGQVFKVPISHGEGRFYADGETIQQLIKNGQIATRYTRPDGSIGNDGQSNPNGSIYAIEGITSVDGRILGKMGHSERTGKQLAKNIYGISDMRLFEAGVDYFK